MTSTLWPRIEPLLAKVQKPARYIGCEDGAQVPIHGPHKVAWLLVYPDAYEVGDEVRAALLERDARAARAFAPARPGHWQLDLYAVARQRLAALGIARAFGGGWCTASDARRFFSYRRDRASERMAAAIWLV